MKIQIQLDSQCEEPEILIRTAAVTAEIRELVEKLSEKRSDSVVGYDADSAVLLEKSQQRWYEYQAGKYVDRIYH